jgi:hypothetical protein
MSGQEGGMNGTALHDRRIVSLILATVACSADIDVEDVRQMISQGDPVLAATRIENDVVLYEHAAGALEKAPQWTLDSVPTARIGGAEGDAQYDLTRVSYVVPFSDGRVMTFARVGNRVLVFSRNGKGERIIGRTGQGPGDWMRFGDPVLLENDTALVLDFANNRLNWVTADGGIVRTAPFEVAGDVRRMSSISGFLPSGELVMHSAASWGGHTSDTLHRSLATVLGANIASGATRTLATLPDIQGVEYETRFRGRARTDWHPLRLSGYALVTGWDSVVATAVAESPIIEMRDASGNIVGRLAVPASRRAVTQSIRDAQIERELGWLNAPSSEGMVDANESRRLAREAPFADSLPYFERLMTGSDQTLWVVDAMAPSDAGWTATNFRNDGAILGRLTVNVKGYPMAFGAGQVIVRTEDENGVVSLHVYRFADKR